MYFLNKNIGNGEGRRELGYNFSLAHRFSYNRVYAVYIVLHYCVCSPLFFFANFYNLRNADDTKYMLRVAEPIFLLVLYVKMHSLSIPLV